MLALKADHEFMLKAVQHSKIAFRYAAPELKANPDIMLKVLMVTAPVSPSTVYSAQVDSAAGPTVHILHTDDDHGDDDDHDHDHDHELDDDSIHLANDALS